MRPQDGACRATTYNLASNRLSNDFDSADNPNTADDFPSSFNGQHVVKIAQRKSNEPVVATHYLYDTEGRLTDVWQPKVHDAVSDTDQWPHWHYTYDGLGNLASITDPKHHVTNFNDTYATSSDAPLYLPGQKKTHIRTLPAVNNTTVTETTTYDSLGRTLKVQDFKGQTTAYAYDDSSDGQGRLFAEYRFAAGVTATDSANAIIKANAAERTEYSYDAFGRQSQVREYASGTGTTTTRVTNYSYDPFTGAISLVDSPEGKVHHEYDTATGRMIETWTGTTHDSATTDTLYGYDQLGRLASVSSAKINGSAPSAPATQRNRFNATGQIVSGNTYPTTDYDYDSVGDLDHVYLPNGDVSDYDYDDLNRLTTLTTTNANNFKLFEQDYTLLSNGQRDFVIEKRFSGTDNSTFSATKIDWGYDDLGRLTSESRDVGNNGQGGEDYIATYTYDLAGNRLSKDFNSANNAHDETITYLYDNRDRLSSEDSSVNANDTSYGYDANGSMISQTKGGTTTAYVWDLRNRLGGIDANNNGSLNDSVDTKYGYDEEGQRVSEQPGNGGSSSRYFVNDKANPTGYPQIIEERTSTSAASSSLDRSYVIGLSILGQYNTSNATLLYLLKDGHGSTRALLTTGGPVSSGDEYDYQAFGEAIGFDPKFAKTIDLFGGDAEFDPTSSLYYHDKRWRQDFRFISMDDYFGDTKDPLTLHRYLYAGDDPVALHDFNGNDFAFETVWAVDKGISLDVAGASVSRAYGRALGISTDIYDITGALVDPYGPLAVTLAWLKGFGEGAAQGFLNALNGVTDAFIGIVNLAIQSSPAPSVAQALGIDITIPESDWSYGVIFDESPLEHKISKFLGGQGLITLATVGVGAVLSNAGEIHHIATVRHAEWTPLFEDLFESAGIDMEDVANKVRVADHFGPHPEAYHAYVYNYLLEQTAGKTGNDLTIALLKALDFLADECATPGTVLNGLITK
jgi:YD repeat-containing protein